MDLFNLLSRSALFSKIFVFLLIWVVESWRPMFEKQRIGRLKHACRNISFAVLNVALLGVFVKTVTTRVTEWAGDGSYGILHFLHAPTWMEWLLALLLIDSWMYVWHRANHRIPFLWRFHRMHHTDLALDVTSASRFHPGELFFSAILRTLLIPIFGLELGQVILYELILMPIILFHHSNISIPEKWDKYLRWLIVSPRMHWVHHSDIQKETDSNYASIFSFWDRCARTFCWRMDPEKIQYGIEDKEVNSLQTIPQMLKTPLA